MLPRQATPRQPRELSTPPRSVTPPRFPLLWYVSLRTRPALSPHSTSTTGSPQPAEAAPNRYVCFAGWGRRQARGDRRWVGPAGGAGAAEAAEAAGAAEAARAAGAAEAAEAAEAASLTSSPADMRCAHPSAAGAEAGAVVPPGSTSPCGEDGGGDGGGEARSVSSDADFTTSSSRENGEAPPREDEEEAEARAPALAPRLPAVLLRVPFEPDAAASPHWRLSAISRECCACRALAASAPPMRWRRIAAWAQHARTVPATRKTKSTVCTPKKSA